MSNFSLSRSAAAAIAVGAIAATSSASVTGPLASAVELQAAPVSQPEIARLAQGFIGVEALELVDLSGLPALGDGVPDLRLSVAFGGTPRVIDLSAHSVRDPMYQVLVDDGSGQLQEVAPGPVRTVRGTVDGGTSVTAAGGAGANGLSLMVMDADGTRWWLQPLAGTVPGAGAGLHAIYRSADVTATDHRCGNDEFRPMEGELAMAAAGAGDGGGAVSGSGNVCVTQLACDADFEYFEDYGSVAAVENRINSVTNTMNLQYETQVNITHAITTIIVRSNANDPYTENGSFGLLCEFITEWTDNEQFTVRDVAQLFTGRNVSGGTIGRAADIGGTGICVNSGGCSGGAFDTFGSFCFSQSDFNGNFSSATDLSAHELGHLWGAFHCNCTSFTMNPFITSANVFSNGSIDSINAYADTRTCISCNEPEPTGACCFPGGTCATAATEVNCVAGGGTFLGVGSDCVDCAELSGACCLSDGTCIVVSESICSALDGDYAGGGTECTPGFCGPTCPADFDGSGAVDFADLVSLLSAFGPCDDCVQDLDGDGEVAFDDLVGLLASFGPCE
ncbi:MAG: M12 family metallo-peptidase [Phycisphaerales bacterium]